MMRRLLVFIVGILLVISFAYAQVNINEDPEETAGVVIFSPTPIPFSNSTFNQTLSDALYWRLDGTNAPPTANWLMGDFGFENLGQTNITAGNNLTLIEGNVSASHYFGNASTLDILLEYLSDVVTTGVLTNEFLQFDGSNWVNFDLFGNFNTFTRTQTMSSLNLTDGARQIVFDSDAASTTTLQDGFLSGDVLITLPVVTSGTLAALQLSQTWTAAQTMNAVLTMGTNTKLQLRSSANTISSQDPNNLDIEGRINMDFLIGTVEQMTLTNGALTPTINNDIDLGSSSNAFKNLHVSGTTDIGNNLTFGQGEIIDNNINGVITITGELNVINNATFQENVTIIGTLFGGSPVKIAGINITDNVFNLVEDRNSSSRFTLQNLNSGSNATTAISALNDVNGSMFIGIGSSNFQTGGISHPNITALFSRSRGDMGFANFFNQAFIWLINLQDDDDPANLVEVMRLDETGLNVSGNITSANVFLPQYIFSHTNETIPVIAVNEWTNVTFGEDEDHIQVGIDHHHDDITNDTFEIHIDGIYDISYGLTLIDTSPDATDIDMAARMIYINGTEIPGSVFQNDIIKQDIETSISHRFLARLRGGNEIKLQFIASDPDVELSDHSIFGDDPERALITINKIANSL